VGPSGKSETPSQVAAALFREAHMPKSSGRRKQALRESVIVCPFKEFCAKRSFSVVTGCRLIAAGKIKVTQLLPRPVGIREGHAREYLDACLRRVS
jgi:hypothetical protein